MLYSVMAMIYMGNACIFVKEYCPQMAWTVIVLKKTMDEYFIMK